MFNSGLDPLLGVFTGVLAFYLHENHPRTAPPSDQRLVELIRWKFAKWKAVREKRLAELDAIEWSNYGVLWWDALVVCMFFGDFWLYWPDVNITVGRSSTDCLSLFAYEINVFSKHFYKEYKSALGTNSDTLLNLPPCSIVDNGDGCPTCTSSCKMARIVRTTKQVWGWYIRTHGVQSSMSCASDRDMFRLTWGRIQAWEIATEFLRPKNISDPPATKKYGAFVAMNTNIDCK